MQGTINTIYIQLRALIPLILSLPLSPLSLTLSVLHQPSQMASSVWQGTVVWALPEVSPDKTNATVSSCSWILLRNIESFTHTHTHMWSRMWVSVSEHTHTHIYIYICMCNVCVCEREKESTSHKLRMESAAYWDPKRWYQSQYPYFPSRVKHKMINKEERQCVFFEETEMETE